ncbi:MAG: hypothetical protein RLZZ82_184, partial [Actinomycetota bacterium]
VDGRWMANALGWNLAVLGSRRNQRISYWKALP